MAPPMPSAPVERSFCPVRTRSTVPRRRPSQPCVSRTTKVTAGAERVLLTRRTVARHRQSTVIPV